MSTLTRRDYRGPFVDIIDWFEAPWTVLRPIGGHSMRVEDYVRDGHYMVRAELPGMDPEKDIELTVSKGVLGITATRHEEAEGKHRSEFRYGTFSRSITLPADADEDQIQASYDYGVLEVAIKIKDKTAEDAHKRIPATHDAHPGSAQPGRGWIPGRPHRPPPLPSPRTARGAAMNQPRATDPDF